MKCRPLSRLFRVAVPFMVVGLAIVLARAGLLAQIGPPTVSIAASATAWENDGKVTVSVMLTSPASQTVTVHYATANGSPPGPAATCARRLCRYVKGPDVGPRRDDAVDHDSDRE